jgi:hypothetical protein
MVEYSQCQDLLTFGYSKQQTVDNCDNAKAEVLPSSRGSVCLKSSRLCPLSGQRCRLLKWTGLDYVKGSEAAPPAIYVKALFCARSWTSLVFTAITRQVSDQSTFNRLRVVGQTALEFLTVRSLADTVKP